MTQDLYTPTDIKKVREILLKEQKGKCAILGIDIKKEGRTAVLDHVHDEEQFVRAVLERESNAFVGVIENAYKRHLAYWSTLPLTDVLNRVEAYLRACERNPDKRYRHTGWIRKVTTKFNQLPAKQQNEVLKLLADKVGKNPTERKKLWKSIVKDRSLGYNTILSALKGVSND